MKIIVKKLEHEVNVSKVNPLKNFCYTLSGFIFLIVIIYYLLGAAVDITIRYIPTRYEAQILKKITPEIKSIKYDGKENIQKLLDDLIKISDMKLRNIRVAIINTNEQNAYAVPGELILIEKELIEEVESENELSMILGHELGHFRNRDHLRGLGRGLLAWIFSVVTGIDSMQDILVRSFGVAQNNFSREQELHADIYGLELLVKKYGHAGGATSFYERLEKQYKAFDKLGVIFATHPASEVRIRKIKESIKSNKYKVNSVLKLKL